jgi:hypothetical protein
MPEESFHLKPFIAAIAATMAERRAAGANAA